MRIFVVGSQALHISHRQRHRQEDEDRRQRHQPEERGQHGHEEGHGKKPNVDADGTLRPKPRHQGPLPDGDVCRHIGELVYPQDGPHEQSHGQGQEQRAEGDRPCLHEVRPQNDQRSESQAHEEFPHPPVGELYGWTDVEERGRRAHCPNQEEELTRGSAEAANQKEDDQPNGTASREEAKSHGQVRIHVNSTGDQNSPATREGILMVHCQVVAAPVVEVVVKHIRRQVEQDYAHEGQGEEKGIEGRHGLVGGQDSHEEWEDGGGEEGRAEGPEPELPHRDLARDRCPVRQWATSQGFGIPHVAYVLPLSVHGPDREHSGKLRAILPDKSHSLLKLPLLHGRLQKAGDQSRDGLRLVKDRHGLLSDDLFGLPAEDLLGPCPVLFHEAVQVAGDHGHVLL